MDPFSAPFPRKMGTGLQTSLEKEDIREWIFHTCGLSITEQSWPHSLTSIEVSTWQLLLQVFNPGFKISHWLCSTLYLKSLQISVLYSGKANRAFQRQAKYCNVRQQRATEYISYTAVTLRQMSDHAYKHSSHWEKSKLITFHHCAWPNTQGSSYRLAHMQEALLLSSCRGIHPFFNTIQTPWVHASNLWCLWGWVFLNSLHTGTSREAATAITWSLHSSEPQNCGTQA